MFTNRHAHAVLSASGSKLWINCAASAYLQSFYPDDAGEAAEEGTFAHAIAAARMKTALGHALRHPETEAVLLKTPEAKRFWCEDMADHVQGYVDRNLEILAEHPDAVVLVEQRVNFSNWVPEGFGTADLCLAFDQTLMARDLKYGRGVDVDVDENTQLALYALGLYAALHTLYEFNRVVVEIDQPRRGGVKAAEYTVDELLDWAFYTLTPAANKAWKAWGMASTEAVDRYWLAEHTVPGDHCHEGFCRARHACAIRAQHMLDIANRRPAEGLVLSDAQLGEILPQLPQVKRWSAEMLDWAGAEAVEAKRKFIGMKLVAGRSSRVVVDEKSVVAALQVEGFSRQDLYHSELLGITALEKRVGKSYLAKVVPEGAIVKRPGAPTLVPETDPRPTWAPSASADDEFDDASSH